jgi:hypothetical protein
MVDDLTSICHKLCMSVLLEDTPSDPNSVRVYIHKPLKCSTVFDLLVDRGTSLITCPLLPQFEEFMEHWPASPCQRLQVGILGTVPRDDFVKLVQRFGRLYPSRSLDQLLRGAGPPHELLSLETYRASIDDRQSHEAVRHICKLQAKTEEGELRYFAELHEQV